MIELNIQKLKGGACIRQFNAELQRAVANILDPNTDAKAKRKVTLTLTMAPNEARNMADISVAVKASLCPQSPVATGATMGVNVETGEQTAFEVSDGQEFSSPVQGLVDAMQPGDSMSINGHPAIVKTADGAVIPQEQAWKM